jgi:high frequency lysogenization protein
MSRESVLRDRVLALAGIVQAASLVRQIAREGVADEGPFQTSIRSLFAVDSDSVDAVYGGCPALARGLDALCRQLDSRRGPADLELTRTVAALLYLERRLARRPPMRDAIGEGIRTAAEQAALFSPVHENVLARLADLYTSSISTLTPRILVQGEPHFLGIAANANRIRALLLAGIRSAVLWRQVGGSRIALILGRRRMLGCARQLLEQEATAQA